MEQKPSTAARYFEDIRLGETWTSAPIAISEEDIVSFARAYDPQPMHVDARAAADGPFGGLIASGWHIASLAMRLSVQGRMFGATPIVGAGVDELRWKQPVRPGDVLRLERTVVELVAPPKQRSRGTVKTRMQMRNQNDEVVLQMIAIGKIPSRPQ